MSSQYRLRKVLLCAILETGALMGAPLLPKNINELMKTMHQIVLKESTPEDSDGSKALRKN